MDGDALLAELARRAVPAGAVRSVGEALVLPSAQAMLLLPAADGHGVAGLRTVAFRSPEWAVAVELSAPPELGAAVETVPLIPFVSPIP